MITREGGAWEAAMALNGRGAYDTTGTPKPKPNGGNGGSKRR